MKGMVDGREEGKEGTRIKGLAYRGNMRGRKRKEN